MGEFSSQISTGTAYRVNEDGSVTRLEKYLLRKTYKAIGLDIYIQYKEPDCYWLEDKNGNRISDQYEYISLKMNASDRILVARKNGKYGFLRLVQGESCWIVVEYIPFIFEDIFYFKDKAVSFQTTMDVSYGGDQYILDIENKRLSYEFTEPEQPILAILAILGCPIMLTGAFMLFARTLLDVLDSDLFESLCNLFSDDKIVFSESTRNFIQYGVPIIVGVGSFCFMALFGDFRETKTKYVNISDLEGQNNDVSK